MNQRELEVTALCDGAATLTKGGNRIASLALLWAAVGIAPTHLRAHRNLAAALANNGDLNAAAEEDPLDDCVDPVHAALPGPARPARPK